MRFQCDFWDETVSQSGTKVQTGVRPADAPTAPAPALCSHRTPGKPWPPRDYTGTPARTMLHCSVAGLPSSGVLKQESCVVPYLLYQHSKAASWIRDQTSVATENYFWLTAATPLCPAIEQKPTELLHIWEVSTLVLLWAVFYLILDTSSMNFDMQTYFENRKY